MSVSLRVAVFSAVLFFFGQCRKIELPPPDEGAPVFFIQAAIDGVPLDIAAGDSTYVMRATYEQDTAGAAVYRGAFEELGCTSGCLPSLRFYFRGAGPGAPQPDTELRLGAYPLRQPDTPTLVISYRAVFSGVNDISVIDVPASFSWDFGDGATSALQNPEHEYENGEPRLVRLETINSNGCVSSMEQKITFGPPILPCRVDFSLQPPQGANPAQAVFDGPFNNYQTWSWFDGDSTLLTSYSIPQLLPQEFREACLTAVNTEGCQSQTCKSAFLGNNQEFGYCATDFTWETIIEVSVSPGGEQFGTVWIEYVDGSGQLFSSALGAQDTTGGDFFRVLSKEPFEPNENGLPTEKLEVSFQCRLYAVDGQPLGTIEGSGAIAVAHP